MHFSQPSVKSRAALQVCLFLLRLFLLSIGWLVLLIGVAWAFGALYRLIPATPERSRALFLDYIKTANELHERAQWYNELTSNCTSNVRLHIKHIGSAHPWDWQLLVNGSIDKHAYQLGAIDTSLPFAELKRLSHINDRARAADRNPAFSNRIHDGLHG